MTTRMLALAFALILPLTACGDGEQTADDSEPGRRADVPLGAFRPDVEDTETPLANRLPGAADQTILVPATTLFPGVGRVMPQIENPHTGEAAIIAGERHFNAFNCSGCHAPLGGGGMGPPLSDGEWIYGGDAAQIFLSIMHGRPDGMPAWSSMLPEQAAWEIVAYVQSLDEIEDYAAAAGFPQRRRQNSGTAGAEPATEPDNPRAGGNSQE